MKSGKPIKKELKISELKPMHTKRR